MPSFTDDDFAGALLALLPGGAVWPRDADATMPQAMGALAPTYTRQSARSANLLVDAFPATTAELLPEWEATLGLPDPCTPLDPSLEQRRAAVLAKFIGSGGQSVPYFAAVAAALGYAITISEFAPFRLGAARLGDPLMGPGWQFVWRVNAPAITVSLFTLGQSAWGDPFWTVNNTELECRIRALAPAHTLVIFQYS